MSLRFYGHPLSSYCWKALIALHEADLAFEFDSVDLSAEPSARFLEISPFAHMPALDDTDHGVALSEASIVIEHLARSYPSAAALLPADPAAALEVRLWDRYFDLHLHVYLQRVVFNRLRPADARDPFGTEQAQAAIGRAYDVFEARMSDRQWAVGEAFSLADCAAAPALHYANKVRPLTPAHPGLTAYLQRLEARPSFARVLADAAPFAHMFPQEPEPA